jgi:hypothetical protein
MLKPGHLVMQANEEDVVVSNFCLIGNSSAKFIY